MTTGRTSPDSGNEFDVIKLIDEFLQGELKHMTVPFTVLLCGSCAVNQAGSRSDIDLCCMGEFTEFSRGSTWFRDVEFQWMIAPWAWYEDVICRYERQGNTGTITSMVAHGLFVRGDYAQCRELQRLAWEFYNKGPEPATDTDIRRVRVQITALWDSWCDENDENVRKWLAFHLVNACVDAHFRLCGWWAVKPKYQLTELARNDPQMNELVGAALQLNEAALEQLCGCVLRKVGGLMRESWEA